MKTPEELRKEAVYLKPADKSKEYLIKLIMSQIERINVTPTRKKYIGLNPHNMTEMIDEKGRGCFDTQEEILYDGYLNAVKREEEPSLSEIRKYFDDRGFKTQYINDCGNLWESSRSYTDSMLKISW